MAATSPITINNNAAVAQTFNPSVAISGGFEYRNGASTVAAPQTIEITHDMKVAASTSNDRHAVTFKQARANALASMRTGFVQVTLSVPKDGLTATDVSDLGAYVRNFLTDANISKILLGQY